MANPQKEIANAWEVLKPAMGRDEHLIRRDVIEGRAKLIAWGGEFFTVLRPEGRELVAVASAGRNSIKYFRKIHALAKAQGFESIRMHVTRPDTFLAVGKRCGLIYQYAETVIRSEL